MCGLRAVSASQYIHEPRHLIFQGRGRQEPGDFAVRRGSVAVCRAIPTMLIRYAPSACANGLAGLATLRGVGIPSGVARGGAMLPPVPVMTPLMA